MLQNLFTKVDTEELCLFWDEIEAIFAREIEFQSIASLSEYRIMTLKRVRKKLYKAAKQAANGKTIKTMEHVIDTEEDIP